MSDEERANARDRPLFEGVTEILADALDLEGDAQIAFLDQACGGDAALRAEVEALLGKQAATRGFLAEQVGRQLALEDADAAPERIGPYLVLDRLGEGGMGTVYLAEQDEPVKRRVALKVIRVLQQASLRQRFAAECQALARLNHPNIAAMYEVGATGEGLPYVAMEWIDGQRITDWCDMAEAEVGERLRLFLSVCSGIGHAHEKGVLHCDLKPGNVLVTEVDGQAAAKVIDFGIARALDEPLLSESEQTKELILGSPPYISPEAMTLAGRRNLDTRTDVYSLGMILYELLVGALPFDVEGKEAWSLLRELEATRPVAPSLRLRALPDDRSRDVVSLRRTSVGGLSRRLRGDLDAIVSKAMARDPARRYGTPAELAADIRRHLTHRPVEAPNPVSPRRPRSGRRSTGRTIPAPWSGGATVSTSSCGFTAGTRPSPKREASSAWPRRSTIPAAWPGYCASWATPSCAQGVMPMRSAAIAGRSTPRNRRSVRRTGRASRSAAGWRSGLPISVISTARSPSSATSPARRTRPSMRFIPRVSEPRTS